MRAATFVYHVLNQLRLLITLALLISLSLTCAIFAYPIEPHRFFAVCTGGLVLVVTLALHIILRMERSELLLRLGRVNGHSKVNVALLRELFVYVVLPILVLVARVFPYLLTRCSHPRSVPSFWHEQ